MMLIGGEVEICKKYSAKDKDGFVHCNECPLVLNHYDVMCHAVAHFDEKKNRWVLDDEENNQDC